MITAASQHQVDVQLGRTTAMMKDRQVITANSTTNRRSFVFGLRPCGDREIVVGFFFLAEIVLVLSSSVDTFDNK